MTTIVYKQYSTASVENFVERLRDYLEGNEDALLGKKFAVLHVQWPFRIDRSLYVLGSSRDMRKLDKCELET